MAWEAAVLDGKIAIITVSDSIAGSPRNKVLVLHPASLRCWMPSGLLACLYVVA
jgi:hypothetical protein